MQEVLGPTADRGKYGELSMIDLNARAERWAGCRRRRSCAQSAGPGGRGRAAGKDPVAHAVEGLKSGALQMACENPDDPANFPRNMFVWRSNILGSSGKGHEYFLKYLLGTQNAVFGDEADAIKPVEVAYEDDAAEGKLDLLTVLDFRMSTTCLYGDIVLPTATWYEKDDLNTSDMHPFIHPLSEAVQPLWESKTDWEIYKLLAKRFSEIGGPYLGKRRDLVLAPLMHDTPGELGQPFEPKDWKLGECDLVPGKTAPNMVVVERDYNDIYRKFTSVGPCWTSWATAARHQLEHRARSARAGRPERQRQRAGREPRPSAPGHGHRRRRDDPDLRARDQRPCVGQGLGGIEQDHRPRARPPGDRPRA